MSLRTLLSALAIITLGLSAGFFLTYQISVMPGLARTDDATYVQSMQSINANVRSAPFAVVFFGPLPILVAAGLAWRRVRPLCATMLTAAAVYALGVLGVTMLGNVPLNDQLATSTGAAEAARASFEQPWLRLHLIRTSCVLAAFASVVVVSLRTWSVKDPAARMTLAASSRSTVRTTP